MRQQLVRSVVVLLLLCTAQLASAQSHKDVVADVVNDLRARGVDIGGPCGALAIVKRVAWRLRAEGAGLLEKTSGNQCEQRAVDIIVYPDGHGFDVLTGSGDANGNGPDWSATPIDSGGSRWRGVAVDPDAGIVATTTPTTTPAASAGSSAPAVPAFDFATAFKAAYDQTERIQADTLKWRDSLQTQLTTIATDVNSPGWFKQVFGNRVVQAALVAAGSWFTTYQMTHNANQPAAAK